jgi:hypothetical protein
MPRIKSSEKAPLKLTQHQQNSLIHCARLKAGIKRKIEQSDDGTQVIEFTLKELDLMHDELSQAAVFAPSHHKSRLITVLKKVDDILEAVSETEKPMRRPTSEADLLYQFKITLLDIKPEIWRRIHLRDCSLADFHNIIQEAMGWESCHLHQFILKGERYGPPSPDDFDFGLEMIDETSMTLSQLLPKSGKRQKWIYEYDFGDGWRHQLAFEGYATIDKKTKYPVCLEGERACPPEDIGGPWGYAEFLEAMSDCDHERHEEFMEWSGPFDPEEFDVKKVTREMRNFRATS